MPVAELKRLLGDNLSLAGSHFEEFCPLTLSPEVCIFNGVITELICFEPEVSICKRNYSKFKGGSVSAMRNILLTFPQICVESSAHGWLGPFSERIPSNSERTPSSKQIPSKFRENAGQIPSKHPKPSISLSFCAMNLLGWC